MKEAKIGNLYLRTRKSWTLDSWFEICYDPEYAECNAYTTLGSWICSIGIDLEDQPGDPSGLHMVLCGREIEAYFPTHINAMWIWSLGEKPTFKRW